MASNHMTMFHDYYAKQVSTSKEVVVSMTRLKELHPSTFPFCGLQTWYNWATMDGVPEYGEEGFSMTYYCTIGTSFHLVIQEVLGRGGKMLGNWKCHRCKTTVKLSTEHVCPKCNIPMVYQELMIRYGDHIVGHCDGVFEYAPKKYVIVDFKTTSTKTLFFNQKTQCLPYKENVSQIESYCFLVENQYGIQIDGWILSYCARDNPITQYFHTGEKVHRDGMALIGERLHRYDSHYGIILRASSLKELSLVVKEKPCKVRSDLRNMESAYSKCPLRDVCFDKDKLKTVLRDALSDADHLPLIDHLR